MTTMTKRTNITPATSLPWTRGPWIKAAAGEAVYANISNGPKRIASISVHGKFRDSGRHVSVRKEDGSYSGKLPVADCNTDADYLCHAANAYPKLVELARIASSDKHQIGAAAAALLRSLGEAE